MHWIQVSLIQFLFAWGHSLFLLPNRSPKFLQPQSLWAGNNTPSWGGGGDLRGLRLCRCPSNVSITWKPLRNVSSGLALTYWTGSCFTRSQVTCDMLLIERSLGSKGNSFLLPVTGSRLGMWSYQANNRCRMFCWELLLILLEKVPPSECCVGCDVWDFCSYACSNKIKLAPEDAKTEEIWERRVEVSAFSQLKSTDYPGLSINFILPEYP